MKRLIALIILFATVLFIGCENHQNQGIIMKEGEIQQKKNDKDSLINDLQNIIDTNLVLEGFSRKISDYSIIKSIPKFVLDTLFKKFPGYYIPNPQRCLENGIGDLKRNEHPYFLEGDFNDDGKKDYVFFLEAFRVWYTGGWESEQRIVILYTKKNLTKILVMNHLTNFG